MNYSADMVTAILVDDNPDFARSAVAYLKDEPGIWLRAVAENVHEALNMIVAYPPDLVLLDIELPDVDGIKAVPMIKALPGAPKIIVLTFHEQDEYQIQAQARGADGFLRKSDFGTDIVPLIRRLFDHAPTPAQSGTLS